MEYNLNNSFLVWFLILFSFQNLLNTNKHNVNAPENYFFVFVTSIYSWPQCFWKTDLGHLFLIIVHFWYFSPLWEILKCPSLFLFLVLHFHRNPDIKLDPIQKIIRQSMETPLPSTYTSFNLNTFLEILAER